jgi:hypothetical protein
VERVGEMEKESLRGERGDWRLFVSCCIYKGNDARRRRRRRRILFTLHHQSFYIFIIQSQNEDPYPVAQPS